MRKPRPLVYSLDEVIITRDDTSAHIKYRDPDFGETILRVGDEVQQMTDQQIVDMYNDTIKSQAEQTYNKRLTKQVKLLQRKRTSTTPL